MGAGGRLFGGSGEGMAVTRAPQLCEWPAGPAESPASQWRLFPCGRRCSQARAKVGAEWFSEPLQFGPSYRLLLWLPGGAEVVT